MVELSYNNKFALLGASRGLGWAMYQVLLKTYPQSHYFLASRKILERADQISEKTKLIAQDFSKVPGDSDFLCELQKFDPSVLIYFAGGGPYGFFEQKKWESHQWCLNTTFLYPAELLHRILQDLNSWKNLRKIVFIGSTIAEDQPDPMAASYSAAKHALKGLISSVKAENKSCSVQVDLFSPGYMQTKMIPANSEAFKSAETPEAVAQCLLEFLK